MGAARHLDKFRYHIVVLEGIIEFLALLDVDDVIGRTVEHNYRRIVIACVVRRTGNHPLVLVAFAFHTDEGTFHCSGAAHADGVHRVDVSRRRPEHGPINAAAERRKFAEITDQVHRHRAGLALFQTAGRRREARKVTARREPGNGHKVRVELVLGRVATDKANHGLDVVQLRRIFGIARRTMVRGHDSITRLDISRTDGAQVRRALHIIAAPGAAVCVDDHRVRFLSLFGNVNVQRMVSFSIASVVHIGSLVGIRNTAATLRATETAKLSKRRHGHEKACRHNHFFHFQLLFLAPFSEPTQNIRFSKRVSHNTGHLVLYTKTTLPPFLGQ